MTIAQKKKLSTTFRDWVGRWLTDWNSIEQTTNSFFQTSSRYCHIENDHPCTINKFKENSHSCALSIFENICYRVWHSYGFWYERISEYIRVKKMTWMNIRIYSYEHFWHERISEYIRMKFFDTNEYSKIFVSKFWYKWISE